MSKRKYIHGVSHRLVLICGVLYILDFLMFNKLTDLFSLEPSLVVNKMEFWRIFTFPFTPGTLEGVFLFIFTFFFIGPKLEIRLRKNFYPVILFLIICLEGTLITLFFWHNNFRFAGMEGLSFFVLVLFTLINLNKKITFWGFRPIKSIMLITLLAITWMSSIAIHSLVSGNDVLIKASSSLIFGIITGVVTYLQIGLFRKFNRTPERIKKDNTKEVVPEEKTPAFIIQNETKRYSQNTIEDNTYINQNEFIFSEQHLNDILDKINEKGKDSLSEEEVNYLKDYSKRI